MGKAKSSYYYKSCLQICLALPLPASLKLNQHWLGTLGNLSNGICSSQSLSMMSMNRTPRLYSSTPGLSSMITAFRSRRLRNSECGSTPHLANHQTNTICLMTEWWQSSPSTLPCIAADCHPRPFLRMVLDSCADFMKSLANYTPNALPAAELRPQDRWHLRAPRYRVRGRSGWWEEARPRRRGAQLALGLPADHGVVLLDIYPRSPARGTASGTLGIGSRSGGGGRD